MNTEELIEKLLKNAKRGEWATHHAAENIYCPYCIDWDTQSYEDMQSHNEGCEFVALVTAAEEWLANNACNGQEPE